MERYLIIKTRDELLRIKIGQILYFEADRNYTKLMLSNGIQFTFAINIGKIEEILETQVAGCKSILMRVGKSHIVNKNNILQINLPKHNFQGSVEESEGDFGEGDVGPVWRGRSEGVGDQQEME